MKNVNDTLTPLLPACYYFGTPKIKVSSGDSPQLYYNFGIESFMLKASDPLVMDQSKIVIDIGIDGAPMANKFAFQAWPILGKICESNLALLEIGL